MAESANPHAAPLRNLRKKLTAIEQLEEERKSGKKLNESQVAKLKTKPQVVADIKELEIKSKKWEVYNGKADEVVEKKVEAKLAKAKAEKAAPAAAAAPEKKAPAPEKAAPAPVAKDDEDDEAEEKVEAGENPFKGKIRNLKKKLTTLEGKKPAAPAKQIEKVKVDIAEFEEKSAAWEAAHKAEAPKPAAPVKEAAPATPAAPAKAAAKPQAKPAAPAAAAPAPVAEKKEKKAKVDLLEIEVAEEHKPLRNKVRNLRKKLRTLKDKPNPNKEDKERILVTERELKDSEAELRSVLKL